MDEYKLIIYKNIEVLYKNGKAIKEGRAFNCQDIMDGLNLSFIDLCTNLGIIVETDNIDLYGVD